MKRLEKHSPCVICVVKTQQSDEPYIALKGHSLDLLVSYIALGEKLMKDCGFTALDMWSAFDSVIHPDSD